MKCLFDTNMPAKLAKTLNFLEGDDGIIVKHLNELFSPDTPDINWIEKLSKEGEWFVITKDNQIRKKPHERKAWQESNIPIVFLPKSWGKCSFWEMAWKLIRYWPELKDNINYNKMNKSFELSINGKISIIG
jgi:hypothetical protein